MLYGIVDIGSNTVRLNVYHCENNDIRVMFSKKENLGLAFYIKKGKLTNKGIKKLFNHECPPKIAGTLINPPTTESMARMIKGTVITLGDS